MKENRCKVSIGFLVNLTCVTLLFMWTVGSILAEDSLKEREVRLTQKIKFFQNISKEDLDNIVSTVKTGGELQEIELKVASNTEPQNKNTLLAPTNSKVTSSKKLARSSKASFEVAKKFNSTSSKSKSKSKPKSQTQYQSKKRNNYKTTANTKVTSKATSPKSSVSNTVRVANKSEPKKAYDPNNPSQKLNYIRMTHSAKKMSNSTAWSELLKIKYNVLSDKDKVTYLQLRAVLLYKAGFHILSSLSASEAISLNGWKDVVPVKKSWEILYKVSEGKSIDTVLNKLIEVLMNKKERGFDKFVPLYFDKSWYYYIGSYYFSKSKYNDALTYFQKLSVEDKLFLASRYQSGIIHVINDKTDKAISSFQEVLNLKAQKFSSMSSYSISEINNYTKLALARLFYQSKKFKDSIKFYKAVDKESSVFYQALSEQAWAFFMIGYTNHALGALYGTQSPFFKDIYNPESYILEAIIYYWMCRYADSKNALADFIENYSKPSKDLSDYLSKHTLTAKIGYELFENYISSVNTKYLGISNSILKTASSSDRMRLLKEQLYYVLEESRRLVSSGVYGSKFKSSKLEELRSDLENLIGQSMVQELKNLNKKFEEQNKQSQFLYIELLMSERSQLLGKELHSQKFDKTYSKDFFTKKDAQSWRGSDKNEYWWDEVGYYKLNLNPQCNLTSNK